MTVKEFKDTQQRWLDRMISWTLIVGIGVGIPAAISIQFLLKTHDMALITGMLIGPACGTLVALLVLSLLRKRAADFEAQHPEMQYLHAWGWEGLPFKDYPVNKDQKSAFAADAEILLQCAAQAANTIFEERDSLREKKNGHLVGSPRRKVLNTLLAKASKMADELNQNYLNLFNLFVLKMEILSGRCYKDAREYREKLR